MAKTSIGLGQKNWPELKKAWDDYGHAVKFEDLFDYRLRDDGAYIVVAWREDGQINTADLYRVPDLLGGWEFLNDGGEPLTEEQWKRVKIVPECDSFDYPSEEEMDDILHQERLEKDKKYAKAFAIYNEGYDDAYGTDNVVEKWLNSNAYNSLKK